MLHSPPNIKDLTAAELRSALTALGEPAYRASQIHQWLFSHHSHSFDDMTILSLALRKKLSAIYAIDIASVQECRKEAPDAAEMPTEKFLIRMPDGQAVESVIIPGESRITACISSQIGCPLGCGFCATGMMGFIRNLSPGEIIDQVTLLNAWLRNDYGKSRSITNIVFMGMGEPLLNTANVLDAIETLSNQTYSFSLPRRKITISTVGVIPEIDLLASLKPGTRLAVSLHAAIQEKRESMMPVARNYPLQDLRRALASYIRLTGQPVTLVYMLIDGVNDSPEDAKALEKFAKGLFCKINLIDYNAIVNIKFKPVFTEKREFFIRSLVDSGLRVTVRKSHGASINAACGQLATERKRQIP
ncbi:MAG: 23S rRNA (adenine(2503)-C(2))-methyltransferase RlmN [Chlorobium sp.]|uniref:23S rRNA (adenine(2503)-C(2))-methyltransferase RlmN n=1 Tax=Chlorobium sp. TaxID=1095 RepID=UPI002F427BD2